MTSALDEQAVRDVVKLAERVISDAADHYDNMDGTLPVWILDSTTTFTIADLRTLLTATRASDGMREALEAAFREGYEDGWATGTAAMEEDRAWNCDSDWERSNARAALSDTAQSLKDEER
jgi:hypothetical protein